MKKVSMFLMVFLVAMLCGCGAAKQRNGLTLQGNCYENMSEFLNYSERVDVSELSQAYLKNISYKIIDIDEDKMMATIDVAVPNVTETLTEIVYSIVEKDKSEASYTDLRNMVEDEFIERLLAGKFELESETVQVPIEEVNGTYKLVSTDELTELIYGNIVKAYFKEFSNIGGEY